MTEPFLDYRPICEQIDLTVGLTLTEPSPLVEALDALEAEGCAMMFYPWLSRPVLLLSLGRYTLREGSPIPILVGGALVITAAGPVVRITLTVLDDPYAPLATECWVNVADSWERDALKKIVADEHVPLVACQGRTITRIISVSLRAGQPPTLRDVVEQGVSSLARFKPWELDWSRAQVQAEAILPHHLP